MKYNSVLLNTGCFMEFSPFTKKRKVEVPLCLIHIVLTQTRLLFRVSLGWVHPLCLNAVNTCKSNIYKSLINKVFFLFFFFFFFFFFFLTISQPYMFELQIQNYTYPKLALTQSGCFHLVCFAFIFSIFFIGT